MTTYYHQNVGYISFNAMKDMLRRTTAPIKKQIERCKANGMPVTGGMLDEMLAQVKAIESFLDEVEIVGEPGSRRTVVRPAKGITHQPGDEGYQIIPPKKD